MIHVVFHFRNQNVASVLPKKQKLSYLIVLMHFAKLAYHRYRLINKILNVPFVIKKQTENPYLKWLIKIQIIKHKINLRMLFIKHCLVLQVKLKKTPQTAQIKKEKFLKNNLQKLIQSFFYKMMLHSLKFLNKINSKINKLCLILLIKLLTVILKIKYLKKAQIIILIIRQLDLNQQTCHK